MMNEKVFSMLTVNSLFNVKNWNGLKNILELVRVIEKDRSNLNKFIESKKNQMEPLL